MPLFLLPLVPLIAAAAGYSTTTVVVACAATGATAGIGVGVGAKLYYGKNKQVEPPTKDMNIQKILSGEKIDGAKTIVGSAVKEVNIARMEVEVAASVVKSASENVHQSVAGIVQTSTNLLDVKQVLKESNDALTASLPVLKEEASKLHNEGVTLRTNLDELNGLSCQKASDIVQAGDDVSVLKNTLNEHVVVITQLQGTVSTLLIQNEAQKETIKEQALENKEQAIEIEVLKVKASTLSKNCAFFSQAMKRAPLILELSPSNHANNC